MQELCQTWLSKNSPNENYKLVHTCENVIAGFTQFGSRHTPQHSVVYLAKRNPNDTKCPNAIYILHENQPFAYAPRKLADELSPQLTENHVILIVCTQRVNRYYQECHYFVFEKQPYFMQDDPVPPARASYFF